MPRTGAMMFLNRGLLVAFGFLGRNQFPDHRPLHFSQRPWNQRGIDMVSQDGFIFLIGARLDGSLGAVFKPPVAVFLESAGIDRRVNSWPFRISESRS